MGNYNLGIAPVDLIPTFLLWINGYVERPETIFPVTPIEIGLEDLCNPEVFDSLPQEKWPTGVYWELCVAIPIKLELECTLQVTMPEDASIWSTM